MTVHRMKCPSFLLNSEVKLYRSTKDHSPPLIYFKNLLVLWYPQIFMNSRKYARVDAQSLNLRCQRDAEERGVGNARFPRATHQRPPNAARQCEFYFPTHACSKSNFGLNFVIAALLFGLRPNLFILANSIVDLIFA